METSSSSPSSLSIESFSYSWLANLKPSLLDSLDNSLRTSLDASDEANSFIEMDPKMPPSKRFFGRISQDFKFDFPSSPSPLGLVHADELISNGYLMPLFLDPSLSNNDNNSFDDDEEEEDDENSPQSSSNSTTRSNTCVPSGNNFDNNCSPRRRCRRVLISKRILQKYLSFLRPLYRRIRGGYNKKSSGGHAEKRVQVGKSRVFSSETASPRISVAYSAPDECYWRKSCDSDSSIYEAVLHCKRSIGN